MSNQKTMDEQFATMGIGKLLFKLSVPAITAQIINALYNIVDRLYIGRIEGVGAMALTGVGVTFPIIMLISAFAALIGMGGAPIASIKLGEGQTAKARQIMNNCFSVLLVLGIVLTAVFFIFKRPLLFMFGASNETIVYAESYIGIYVLGTVTVQISLGMNSFINAQGFAKTGMATVIIGAVTNIVLDPIFIFGFKMGVRGAAIATVIAQTVSAVWVVVFLCGKKAQLRLNVTDMTHINPKFLGRALALGLSPFIMQSTESLVQITLNRTLSQFGGDMFIGAMVILSSIMQMFMMPLQGLTQGSQPIIGYNYGAKNYARVKKTIRYVAVICFSFSSLFFLLSLFAPRALASVFTADQELLALSAQVMRIFFFGSFMFGLQIAFQNSFVSLGQAKVSIFLALLRKIILLIPLAMILPRLFGLGAYGVFYAEPIADILAATTTITFFIIKSKKLFANNSSAQLNKKA